MLLDSSFLWCDLDAQFSLEELGAALQLRRKEWAPVENGISYKALCKVGASCHPLFL